LPAAAIPTDSQKCGTDHGKLAGFDSDIERDESRHKFRTRQAQLFQHTGEPHSMKQAENENERNAPRLEFRHEDVFDGDVRNRYGNQRLHYLSRDGDEAIDA